MLSANLVLAASLATAAADHVRGGGGTIHVESQFGKGSAFTVWLPLESQELVLDEEIARMAREANEAVVD